MRGKQEQQQNSGGGTRFTMSVANPGKPAVLASRVYRIHLFYVYGICRTRSQPEEYQNHLYTARHPGSKDQIYRATSLALSVAWSATSPALSTAFAASSSAFL